MHFVATQGLDAGAIFAIWHDPTVYDHMQMGPPYLPDAKTARTASGKTALQDSELGTVLEGLIGAYNGLPMSELAALLSVLRSANLIHQSHHWRTRGGSFYGDHLMFERLYNDSLPFIDQVAERAVGSGSHLLVRPEVQANQISTLTALFCGEGPESTSDGYVRISLATEIRLLALLDLVYGRLEGAGNLSSGTDNLLQGLADKHEEFVYLLRQRAQSKLSYDRRKDWTAPR